MAPIKHNASQVFP